MELRSGGGRQGPRGYESDSAQRTKEGMELRSGGGRQGPRGYESDSAQRTNTEVYYGSPKSRLKLPG